MNSALKHWREAATLIVAAGRRLGPDTSCGRTPLTSCYYDVLLLKRSGRSGFMPSASVFPGGTVESADFSGEWLHVFESFSKSPNFGLRSVKQPAETRPPIFATDRRKLGSPLPGEVAFRICALRETFEESGVLLCVSKQDEERVLDSAQDRAHGLCSGELSKWRALVNRDPSNFIQMCRELELLPNIWALHEWSNWLTPTGRYGGTRFDTAFFICCLQDRPHTVQDEKEIVHFQWSTPSEVLQSYQAKELWTPPPQFYELSRMCRFPSLNDLHNFASQRATEGCEQWMPVVFSKDEQSISLLPGDKLYPSDTSGEMKVDVSADPQQNDHQEENALHRMVMSDLYTTTVQISITPKYKHLLPVVEPAVTHSSKSEL